MQTADEGAAAAARTLVVAAAELARRLHEVVEGLVGHGGRARERGDRGIVLGEGGAELLAHLGRGLVNRAVGRDGRHIGKRRLRRRLGGAAGRRSGGRGHSRTACAVRALLAHRTASEALLAVEEVGGRPVGAVLRGAPCILVLAMHEFAIGVGVDADNLLELGDLDVGRLKQFVDLGAEPGGRDARALLLEVVVVVVVVGRSRCHAWMSDEGSREMIL